MKRIEFYLQKSPNGKGYIARPTVNSSLGKREFIDSMVSDNPELSEEMVEKVFKQARSTLEKVIMNGSSLVIPGFVTVKPVIKGTFKDIDDKYSEERHPVVPTVSFSAKFVNFFKGKVRGSRKNRGAIVPEINLTTNSRGEEWVLSRRLATRFYGTDLKRRGWSFCGLELRSSFDRDKLVRIGLDELEVLIHKGKELCINIDPYFQPPAWLEEEKRLHLGLLYRRENSDYEEANHHYSMRWKGDGE